MRESDQGFLHDATRPLGSRLKLGTLLGRVGSSLGGFVERSRMLSGEVERSTRGSRALREGKAIIPGAFCLGKLRQGGLWEITITEGARATPRSLSCLDHSGRRVVQSMPSLGTDVNVGARASG